MARFNVQETWREHGVDVELYRVQPLEPGHAARLIERGMLKADDEPVGQFKIGEFTIGYPEGGFPKKVRRAALAWLAEHAGMTEADSVEIQLSTDGVDEVLARLEAAVSA